MYRVVGVIYLLIPTSRFRGRRTCEPYPAKLCSTRKSEGGITMKICWGGKQTCRWCHWRDSGYKAKKHHCAALPQNQIPVRGCFCRYCIRREWINCPLVSGMKKPEQWCDVGETWRQVVCEVSLDNTCALFRKLDLSRIDPNYHPLSVRRAAEKLADKRKSEKSNPGGLGTAARKAP